MNISVTSIVWIALAASIVGIFLYERITGKSLFSVEVSISPIFKALKHMVAACSGVFPSPYFDKAAKVIEICVDATVEAENMWKDGQLMKEQRADYCQLIIAKALKESGIEVNEQLDSIIHGAISLVCMLMPHSGVAEEVAEVKKESQVLIEGELE